MTQAVNTEDSRSSGYHWFTVVVSMEPRANATSPTAVPGSPGATAVTGSPGTGSRSQQRGGALPPTSHDSGPAVALAAVAAAGATAALLMAGDGGDAPDSGGAGTADSALGSDVATARDQPKRLLDRIKLLPICIQARIRRDGHSIALRHRHEDSLIDEAIMLYAAESVFLEQEAQGESEFERGESVRLEIEQARENGRYRG